MGKRGITINLPSKFFTTPKYLFVFCGTLPLNHICDNRDANTFDFHSFLFAASYLMFQDSFMLYLLKGASPVSFRLSNTILPTLYVLLNLELDFLCTLTWFESRFKFFNHDFVCSIKHLPYQAFRCRFLNFKCHNERNQEHFFNDFLGRAHCTTTCDICTEHDSIHFSRIYYELSRFRDNYLMMQMTVNSVLLLTLMSVTTNFSQTLHQPFHIIDVQPHVLFLLQLNQTSTLFLINQC